jgi:diguanylate cyclase (GGDEF)-like protein
MSEERRSENSIGARLRGPSEQPGGWGAWGGRGLVAAATAVAAAQAPKVLIVDDSPAARARHREALSAFRAELVEAGSGSEALLAVREHDFALILLDTTMPEMDGFELSSLLRLEPRAAAVPVMFILPADATPDVARLAYRMGAVDCLVDAPLDGEILRQKAHVFFEIYTRRANLALALDRSDAELRQARADSAQLVEQQVLLQRQSTRDELTNLPNRRLFEDRLDGALNRAKRNRTRIALALLDLNGFRKLNDEHGHGAGDELLSTVGKRLVHAVRASDTVARLGGDEFAVVLEGLQTVSTADYLGHKMGTAVSQPCTLLVNEDGKMLELEPSTSIGLAIYPDHAKERDELIAAADASLSQARRAGGGVRVFGASEDQARADARAVGVRKA